MRAMFSNYLVERGYVDAQEAGQITSNAQNFAEIIGALAMRNGLMTSGQIEEVLSNQQSGQLFGQAAVQHGHLSQDDVDRLLDLQALQEALEIGSILILKGRMTSQALVDEISSFFHRFEQPMREVANM